MKSLACSSDVLMYTLYKRLSYPASPSLTQACVQSAGSLLAVGNRSRCGINRCVPAPPSPLPASHITVLIHS